MVRIEDLEAFRNAIRQGKGYFVITDITNTAQQPKKFHDVRCSFISEKTFVTKVIENHSKNGEYYWCENRSDAEKFGARPCSRCL